MAPDETTSSAPTEQPIAAFIGIRKACEIAGFSKSSLLRMQKRGAFPLPVINEKNVVRYDLAEVMEWRAAQFRKRDERAAPQADERASA